MKITMQELMAFIHDRYIARGRKIIQDGSLVIDRIGSNNVNAYAIGTSTYYIVLSRKNNLLMGTCTCPAFIDFGPCKHIAATGLALLTTGYQPDEFYCEQKENLKNTMNLLSKKSKNELLLIIMQCIGQSPDLMDIIEGEIND